ncbi:MAG: DUF1559 domain-containing protein [Planctomycetaceae bacterium]|nr:DUF1559 domain-containing protein [Planctomycetaceae bacterium]
MKFFTYLLITICVVSLIVFIPFMLFTDVPLRISTETTCLTEPLTADGKRVDYFRAIELRRYPPEMQTEDNGYRLIVQALGPPSELTDPGLLKQYYEKLGLPPTHVPTTPYIGAFAYLKNHFTANPDEFEKAKALYRELKIAEIQAEAAPDRANRIAELENREFDQGNIAIEITEYQRKNYTKYPIMTRWVTEVTPALDTIAEAVRKPVYAVPIVRFSDRQSLVETLVAPDMYSFAQSLQSRASYRLETGDIDGVIDDAVSLRRLGRFVGKQGTLTASLVGIAIEGMGYTVGPNENPEFPMSAEQIRRFLQELDALPEKYDLTEVFEIERFFILDTIQSIFDSSGRRENIVAFFEAPSWTTPSWFEQIYYEGLGCLGYNWNIVLKDFNWEYDHFFDPTYVFPIHSKNPLVWLGTNARSRELAIALRSWSPLENWQNYTEAGRRSDCLSNMQRIVLAMLLYEREHGTLPPAFTVDTTGKPLHSWRVLLLPYLGEQELYEKIRLDEPWDSEHNKQFHDTTLAVYQCPSVVKESETLGVTIAGQTNYTVLVGDDTPFGLDGNGRSAQDFSPYTILLTEQRDFKPWMQPDAEVSQADAESFTTIDSLHYGGINYGSLSGASRFLQNTIQRDRLQKLIRGTAKDYTNR